MTVRAYEIEGWDSGTKIRRSYWNPGEYILRGAGWRNENYDYAETWKEALLYADDWEPYVEEEVWYIHTYWGAYLGIGKSKVEVLTQKTWSEITLPGADRIHLSTIKCDKNGKPL